MAGSNPTPYYTPTSKHTAATYHSPFPLKRPNLYSLVAITFLCSAFYFTGLWQNRGSSSVITTSNIVHTTIPCFPSKNTSTNSPTSSKSTQKLDFTTHHSTDDGGAVTPDDSIKIYPPCDIKYSEYTPCEDPERSLKFNRNRLIYRERHCPEKNELLKCRIPAPYGYKNPFKWPISRDLAWYANVPHKELTVEKAVQNWIRYEGDRFRFPGGGTMFPNGADAYIDDIGKLINLNDGSIRTAIDTGCGVIFSLCSFDQFLLFLIVADANYRFFFLVYIDFLVSIFSEWAMGIECLSKIFLFSLLWVFYLECPFSP